MDMWIGVCHGYPVIGYCFFGATTVMVNDFESVRVTDILTTTCPICGAGIVLEGSLDVLAEDLGVTRVNDPATYGVGSGIAATGSPDVIVD